MKDAWRRLVGFEEWDTNHDGNLSVRLKGCLEIEVCVVLIAPSYLSLTSLTSLTPLIPLILLTLPSHL